MNPETVAAKLNHSFPGVQYAFVGPPNFRWLEWRGNISPPTLDEITALPEPPPPAARWSTLDFIERFPLEKQLAILQSNDPFVRLFIAKATAAGTVVADDPRTLAGMAYLVQVGLITQEESDSVLSNN